MAAGTGNPRLSRYAEDRRQHQLITGKIKFLVLFLTAFLQKNSSAYRLPLFPLHTKKKPLRFY